jgi:hypothetical protein
MGCVDTSSPLLPGKDSADQRTLQSCALRMSFPKSVTGKAHALRELLMEKDDQAEAGRRTWASGLS